MNRSADRLYTAPELADALGVTARALRFYETKGLLKPRRIVILRGKRLGFSLAEIAEYLELYHADPTQVEQLKRLESMLYRRLEALEQQRAALETTLTELGEIRLQVMQELESRGVKPLPQRDAARRSRPRIRAKSTNGSGRPEGAAQGDD
jgi:DNA-binding transcriptional MerR regulator